MMKFALIHPWQLQSIYFETEDLAKIAKARIEESTGRICEAIIVRVGNDLKPRQRKSSQ